MQEKLTTFNVFSSNQMHILQLKKKPLKITPEESVDKAKTYKFSIRMLKWPKDAYILIGFMNKHDLKNYKGENVVLEYVEENFEMFYKMMRFGGMAGQNNAKGGNGVRNLVIKTKMFKKKFLQIMYQRDDE